MKKTTALILIMILLVLASIAAYAAVPSGEAQDAATIHRLFEGIHRVLDGLMGLIQPIGALLLAVNVALTVRALRNQKVAAIDRAEATAILHAQNDTMATIKTAVAPPADPE